LDTTVTSPFLAVDYRRWVTSVSFALVDVFADEPLSGNPLAVVPDADHLSEDPATGTAAGPLACLLHRYGLAGDRAVIAQGHHLGRPARIEVTLDEVTLDGDTPMVAGRAVISATGTLCLP
jgi:predicted PhzF superfamily epimerase YddE/YHI9